MSADFCQSTVGSNVQYGRRGPRLKVVSSAFQARNAADSGFVTVAGADPIADDDFVTKRWGQANIGGVAGAAGVIYEDLQFYMDAADRSSFNPAVGTPTDIMGNGSGGTLNADAVFADGAFLFDGASGNVNFVKSGDLNNIFGTSGPSDGGTIMVFTNPVSGGEGGSGRVVDTTDGLAEGYFIFLDNPATGALGVQFARQFTGGNAQWDTDSRQVQRDGWNGVTVRYDDTDVANDPTFSLQGVTVNSNNTGAGPSGTAVSDVGNNLFIGNSIGDARTFNGQIAVIFMWNRILTDAEVFQAHNNFFSRFARTGSVTGIVRSPAPGSVSDDLIGDRGVDSPTIAVTSFGGSNINLQSETTTSRGIFGSSTSYAGILSGRNNIIRSNNDFCGILSGVDNEIDDTGGSDSVICGGSNHILGDASNCIIGGGAANLIKPGSGSISFSGVFSGERNDVTGGSNSVVCGGEDNIVGGPGASQTSDWSFIGGGDQNDLRGDYGVIGGGFSNNIGVVISAAAQYATIPGGRSNRIGGSDNPGFRGDYGFASGRQSHVLHDGCTVMSDGNAINAESIIQNENFLAFAGGIRRVTTNGFRGEAWVTKNSHITTTDTTPTPLTLDVLDTDQHTMVLMVDVQSARDTGDNFMLSSFLVYARRTGGTLSVTSSTVVTPVGGGVTQAITAVGDTIVLTVTAAVGPENWQHTVRWRRQEGGFTS